MTLGGANVARCLAALLSVAVSILQQTMIEQYYLIILFFFFFFNLLEVINGAWLR